jgi:hypothetical protein
MAVALPRSIERVEANGGIVAVGRGLGLDGSSDFALARYLGG